MMQRNQLKRAALMSAASVMVLGLAMPALAQTGFSIALDGTHVGGDLRATDPNRKTDKALSDADIRVSFDGLGAKPTLNVAPVDRRMHYPAGATVPLLLDANYAPWIERAEIRILAADGTLAAVLPATIGGVTNWAMPADGGRDYAYLARVYDSKGRYDETHPLPLSRGDGGSNGVEPMPVWGDDNTARRSITVEGGIVSVHGADLPAGSRVHFLGESVPVDAKGAFVAQRILPAGDHSIEVTVDVPTGKGMMFTRGINIPSQDWFYVGMADVTVGKRWGDAEIVAADPDEFDDVYAKGRAAFYLKGKIKGEYLLTASGDTGEGPLDQMFTGVVSSDPQAVLRRIDPSQFYPVYGDDSVAVDDAPTRGKFYVRLEKGESSVVWGNFRTLVGDSSLLRAERSLYGAAARIVSDEVTPAGQPVYEASLHAAQPGTLPARDVLRGTGGSAYVLRRQDVAPGTEIVTVEKRDAISNIVTSSTTLRAGVDYTINYMQGLVLLTRPLAASERTSEAVQSSSDDTISLVVQYEYSPPTMAPDEVALGGSGTVRFGDAVSVSGVGLSEQQAGGGELTVYGGKVRLSGDEGTFLEAEVLRSEGSAGDTWLSTDGGMTYAQQPAVGASDGAHAYRVAGRTEFGDDDGLHVVAGFTAEKREAGFATPDQQVAHDTFALSSHVTVDLGDAATVSLDWDHIDNATGARRDEATAELTYALAEDWSVSVGVLHRDESRPGGDLKYNGSRTDLGARLTYRPSDDLTLSGFGQTTLRHSAGYRRNDRIGASADFRLARDWTVSAETSIGTTGPEALISLGHETGPGKRTYIGARMQDKDADHFFTSNRAISGIVMGTEQQLNDVLSIRSENNYGLWTDDGTTTGLYGVDFRPDKYWSGSATYETGHIEDELSGSFDRHALSVALGFKDDDLAWTGKAELRLEESEDGTRDRNTVLLQSGLSIKTDPNWRLLADFDGLFSSSDQSAILDGDYVEASLGAAYRPVDNDRLNALFRYTYLYDLPGPDQVNGAGLALGPSQRSHILSLDANYDLTNFLTVGAKYGLRVGEVSETRDGNDFVRSEVHLGIIRADLAVLEDWHLLLEARALYDAEAAHTQFGALGVVSYDISDEVRAGLGYNFGQFSDDLRDLTQDDYGLFLNMAAKF